MLGQFAWTICDGIRNSYDAVRTHFVRIRSVFKPLFQDVESDVLIGGHGVQRGFLRYSMYVRPF